MNPFEDAYTSKCHELRQAQILNEELKNSLDKEREKSRRVEFQMTEIQKALHMSRTGACVTDHRPVVTIVTTIRKGGEMLSRATVVDEMLVLASKSPEETLGRELNHHLRKIQSDYFSPNH